MNQDHSLNQNEAAEAVDNLINKLEKKASKEQKHVTYKDCEFIPYERNPLIESPIFSSVFLQKLMYFNKYYDYLFFYLMIITFLYKLFVFQVEIFDIIRVIMLIAWGLIEIARLYSGYYGNLKEAFADLFSFMILTFLNTCLIGAFTGFPKLLPIELACNILYFIFVFAEFLIGCCALSRLVKSQTALFFLRSPKQGYRKKGIVFDKESKKVEEEPLKAGNEDIRKRKTNNSQYAQLNQDDK